MPRLRRPRALRRGATVGIAAPGGVVDPERLEAGEALLRDAGFHTVRRDDLLARRAYLAGDDGRRAAEFMGLVADPRVDGIVCARGGYGCDRILPRLDPEAVRAAAKPLVGYSDVTALLLWQRRRAGLMGLHGPMLDRGADVDPAAFAALVAQLTGEAEIPVVLRGAGRGGGSARGRLVGGSLTLVTASLGTAWEIETKGAILLLEDRGELPYRVDRMLQQLRGAGKLERAAGVGLGDFSTCVDDRFPEASAESVIAEVLRPFGIPLVTGLPFGHRRENFPWPVGARATIDGDRGEVRILESGVVSAP
ncbi:MAG: LD-carboxypeptidase [Myxococcales bacterium]|nr:LD-carboxypeptidase [Myxococcales bacterium]